jgi:hypothetical protein
MRRLIAPLLILGCFLALILACYGPALLGGRQLAFRDAAHFYYPLYQLVQQEWNEGRWPLWEPEENGGMPLLGNPTAAVLYPGKLIYFVLPYPWAARLYAVAHTVLAFGGMVALMRWWGTSWTGAAVSGLSYAFGAPILFQYCNIIFLVGAAWLPLGFRAIDRWLRAGRRWGLIELAVILALQTLGGDPEASYATGLCAAGYAVGLSGTRARTSPGGPRPWWRRLGAAAAVVAAAAAWVGGALFLAAWLPTFRPRTMPPSILPWMPWVPAGVALGWVLAGLVCVLRWRRRGGSVLGTMLAGLSGAAVLGAALAGAQLVPVLEFTRQSVRAAGEGPHDIYPFSLEPIRLVELAWPNAFGSSFGGNRYWLTALPPRGRHARIWIPSLYMSGLATLLALGAIGFRGGPPWRSWLSAVALISLAAALGEYTSPLWWARLSPAWVERIGPPDPYEVTAVRIDGQLRDGDGSFYWFLTTVLPGFRQFRYPSKLLSFTALALAGLAGLGWDRAAARRSARVAALAACALAVSVCALAATFQYHDRLVAALKASEDSGGRSSFGPNDFDGALVDLKGALVHGAIVQAIGFVVAVWAWRRAGLAGAVVLLVVTIDLAVANARNVLTVPQHLFDTKPRVIELIEAAERDNPARGPFRIHRMPIWEPLAWRLEASRDRVRDFVVWERDTIQPKYGLPYGIQYTLTIGVAELFDYEFFFGPFPRTLDDDAARALGVSPGQKVVYYPRRSFDLWNTRYFVIPSFCNDWMDEQRGFASFLLQSERIYPPLDRFDGSEGEQRRNEWMEREDFQIRRNRTAFPRAWVVHEARYLEPISGLKRSDRREPMEELLYANDPFWKDPTRVVFDPRSMAWIETGDRRALADYLSGGSPNQSETATITRYDKQQVELDVVLDRPGLVVLADVYYPGWRLTIDGRPAPIYRANRLMRGAAVKAGRYHLVFTYQPDSFRIGAGLSLAGLTVLVALGAAFRRRPASSRLAPADQREAVAGTRPIG